MSEFHCAANFLNSSEANAGPLSETTLSGIPCRPNATFRACMTGHEAMFAMRSTSIKLE